jgi:hypothetical protein
MSSRPLPVPVKHSRITSYGNNAGLSGYLWGTFLNCAAVICAGSTYYAFIPLTATESIASVGGAARLILEMVQNPAGIGLLIVGITTAKMLRGFLTKSWNSAGAKGEKRLKLVEGSDGVYRPEPE